jgi:DNA-entry nuclease
MANKSKRIGIKIIALIIALMAALLCTSCAALDYPPPEIADFFNAFFGGEENSLPEYIDVNSIPEYSNKAYVEVNGNTPFFTEADYTTTAYENYSELDSLGRCGVVMACLGKETMPKKDEDRGSINNVTPSGWVQKKYDASLVSGGWLYNRCHLIGWQLSAENDNEKNLITGTRYFNAGNSEEQGMLLFENMVADYIKETGNHVLYRVTPVYNGNNLLASGILMEAYSVEDNGEGICFNVYFYNVQPGVEIDYATGESRLAD